VKDEAVADARRLRVALVYGGRSSEHAVSCVSAGSVLAALDRSVWDVVPVGITSDGRWTLEPDDPDQLRIRDGVLPTVAGKGDTVVLAADPTHGGLLVERTGAVEDVDVVFPLLHGPYGEDGTVQGLLELAGVPYVGSGVLSSAASMDKAAMKVLLAGAGLPVGPYVVIEPSAWERDQDAILARVATDLAFPVFVKPARGGSSVGISKVDEIDGLVGAVELARTHDPKVVVEQGLSGREIECGVLDPAGSDGPRASLPAEVRVHPDHAFYDFHAKYIDGADLDVPARLAPEDTAAVQALAVRAFEAMGCEGLARVDFFLAADGTLVINEVNTMPGFTPSSMFPQMWAATGVDYASLIDTLLRAALARPLGLR
jgi:D-alanine-D-alanine ligase